MRGENYQIWHSHDQLTPQQTPCWNGFLPNVSLSQCLMRRLAPGNHVIWDCNFEHLLFPIQPHSGLVKLQSHTGRTVGHMQLCAILATCSFGLESLSVSSARTRCFLPPCDGLSKLTWSLRPDVRTSKTGGGFRGWLPSESTICQRTTAWRGMAGQ